MKLFEALQRSVKIKISDNFFSSSGMGTGRVKTQSALNWNLEKMVRVRKLNHFVLKAFVKPFTAS